MLKFKPGRGKWLQLGKPNLYRGNQDVSGTVLVTTSMALRGACNRQVLIPMRGMLETEILIPWNPNLSGVTRSALGLPLGWSSR